MLGNAAYAELTYSEDPPIFPDVLVQLPSPNQFVASVGNVVVNQVLLPSVSATITLSSSFGVNQFVLNGVTATISLGTVTVQELNISGVQATGQVGNVFIWGPIIDLGNTTWTEIDPDRDTSYTNLTPDNSTTWINVGGMT